MCPACSGAAAWIAAGAASTGGLAALGLLPHESTSDQFYGEDQFESYRRLGHHIATLTVRDVEHERSLVEMARNLYDLWTQSSDSASFVAQAEALDEIWERFRTSPLLEGLLTELMADRPSPLPDPLPGSIRGEQLAACLEFRRLARRASARTLSTSRDRQLSMPAEKIVTR